MYETSPLPRPGGSRAGTDWFIVTTTHGRRRPAAVWSVSLELSPLSKTHGDNQKNNDHKSWCLFARYYSPRMQTEQRQQQQQHIRKKRRRKNSTVASEAREHPPVQTLLFPFLEIDSLLIEEHPPCGFKVEAATFASVSPSLLRQLHQRIHHFLSPVENFLVHDVLCETFTIKDVADLVFGYLCNERTLQYETLYHVHLDYHTLHEQSGGRVVSVDIDPVFLSAPPQKRIEERGFWALPFVPHAGGSHTNSWLHSFQQAYPPVAGHPRTQLDPWQLHIVEYFLPKLRGPTLTPLPPIDRLLTYNSTDAAEALPVLVDARAGIAYPVPPSAPPPVSHMQFHGLVLQAPTGTGKTDIAACLALSATSAHEPGSGYMENHHTFLPALAVFVVPSATLQQWHNVLQTYVPQGKLAVFHNKHDLDREVLAMQRMRRPFLKPFRAALFNETFFGSNAQRLEAYPQFRNITPHVLVVDEFHTWQASFDETKKRTTLKQGWRLLLSLFEPKYRILVSATPAPHANPEQEGVTTMRYLMYQNYSRILFMLGATVQGQRIFREEPKALTLWPRSDENKARKEKKTLVVHTSDTAEVHQLLQHFRIDRLPAKRYDAPVHHCTMITTPTATDKVLRHNNLTQLSNGNLQPVNRTMRTWGPMTMLPRASWFQDMTQTGDITKRRYWSSFLTCTDGSELDMRCFPATHDVHAPVFLATEGPHAEQLQALLLSAPATCKTAVETTMHPRWWSLAIVSQYLTRLRFLHIIYTKKHHMKYVLPTLLTNEVQPLVLEGNSRTLLARLRMFHKTSAPLLVPQKHCTGINLPAVHVVVVPYKRSNVQGADLTQFIGRVTRYGKHEHTTVLYLHNHA